MVRRSLILYFLSVFAITAVAQSNNVRITQFSKSDFNADAEFWSMCETTDGTLFFGNNDGVLIYDGEHWQKIVLPNNSSVRYLTASGNTVYAGAYNEAGVIRKDKWGTYNYTSLTPSLQLEGRNIENIWNIALLGNKTVFRSNNEIIITSGSTATRINSVPGFEFSALVGSQYFVQEKGHGLFRLDQESRELTPVVPATEYNDKNIAALLPGDYPATLLAVTTDGVLYSIDLASGTVAAQQDIFKGRAGDQVTGAIKNTNGSLYLSTAGAGIIVVNRGGQVLQNPGAFGSLTFGVVHSIFRASDNNLWILQNNGLQYADFRSPYATLFNKASVYDALVTGSTLYLATTQGVYYAPFDGFNPPSPGAFKKVSGLVGQAWTVQELDGDIIVSHDAGLYKIANGTAQKIGGISGFWKAIPAASQKGLFLAAQYNGLYLLKHINGQWQLGQKVQGFNESARDILPADEPNTYWICHGYQGIFHVKMSADYTRASSVGHFTNTNGLPNSFNVNVFRWNGTIVFTTNAGIYTYNARQNRFVPYSTLNSILHPTKNTRKLLAYGNRTWFVQDDEAGYFITSEKKPELHKDMFLNLKSTFNRGMECIVPLKGGKVFFGTTNGLLLYTTDAYALTPGLQTTITKVSFYKNQKQQSMPLRAAGAEPATMPNQTDVLRFDFSSPKMTHGTQVQYSYLLENVDQGWSAWQNIPFKEYTHLRPGTYTFKVKSRNTAGLIGSPDHYIFTIKPEWYQTMLAYGIYALAALAFVFGIRVLVKRRIQHEREKTRREAERAKKLLELEVEQLKLQRDKEAINRDKAVLEEDVINKSKELANYTLLLMQKKDAFAEITDDLKELKDYLRNEESRKKLLEIFQKLNRHKVGEEYMEVFDVHFEKVHHNFFERLKGLNPTLTQRELRLCAFVKMGLSNKEIAPLLGISLRGVENARYRIRKKLGVSNEDNFPAFLEGIVKEEVV